MILVQINRSPERISSVNLLSQRASSLSLSQWVSHSKSVWNPYNNTSSAHFPKQTDSLCWNQLFARGTFILCLWEGIICIVTPLIRVASFPVCEGPSEWTLDHWAGKTGKVNDRKYLFFSVPLKWMICSFCEWMFRGICSFTAEEEDESSVSR